jgi:integration host factor subunit beta
MLIKLVAERANLAPKHAERVVKTIFDTMSGALGSHDRIEIRGFGTFSIKHYPAYTGRNPRSGAVVDVPAKTAIKFKVGKGLRELVNAD